MGEHDERELGISEEPIIDKEPKENRLSSLKWPITYSVVVGVVIVVNVVVFGDWWISLPQDDPGDIVALFAVPVLFLFSLLVSILVSILVLKAIEREVKTHRDREDADGETETLNLESTVKNKIVNRPFIYVVIVLLLIVALIIFLDLRGLWY